ncbi:MULTISPECIES: diguanylate cyclase [unclassified Actinoplanes]|uniref:tetratricopeptide repeat-containing diguanylate cyclase n=1 Tax=unclassified Actinoplanes TaxID=2626549 RepID=UPI0003129C5A|nr:MULTISPECIES: diguanylate cyclase [unclassified Actinoplanes]
MKTPLTAAGELAMLVDRAARLVRDPQRRVALARDGIERATALGDEVARVRCTAMVTEFTARHGQPVDALSTALSLIGEAVVLGDPLATAQAHHTAAMCLHLLDCVPESMEHGYEALDAYRKSGDAYGEGRVLSLVATLLAEMGDRRQALELLEQAHGLFLACADASGAATMLAMMADGQREIGDPVTAAETGERALRLFGDAGMPVDAQRAMTAYAHVLADLNRLDDAERWLGRAGAHNRLPDGAIANQGYEMHRLLVLVRSVLNPSMRWDAARETLERVIALAGGLRSQRSEALAESLLAEVLHATGDDAGAYDHLLRCRELADAATRGAQERRTQALRVRFEVAQAQREAERYRRQAEAQAAIIAELEQARATLAGQMADLQRLNEEVLHLSRTDPLTGIANRRRVTEHLTALAERNHRYDAPPVAIAVFDVDRFKSVNDGYGHEVGDRVLVALSRLMADHLRVIDLPARLGGDEFVIIMPGLTVEGALRACHRLLEAVRRHPWQQLTPGLAVRISIGVADGTGVTDPDEMLRHADAALYRAKEAGRDAVVTASRP